MKTQYQMDLEELTMLARNMTDADWFKVFPPSEICPPEYTGDPSNE